MDLDQKFVKLYEGCKKGKYKITDDKGNIIGTYNSGSKAQKVVDDLMQQGKYDKLTVEIIEDLEKEARTYLDRADDKKKKKRGITPQSQKKSRWGGGGYGKGEEVEVDESAAKYAKSLEKIANDKALKMLTKSERENLKKIATLLSKEKTLGEAYKDLPPHLQKLIKKIEKKQKDWNKQNPNAKIKTLVYNPETGKPDIEVKENTMDLKDTIKKVIEDNSNDKSDDGEGLDKVQPKAVKKKFKDRKDKDIDNDGDVDSSDKFLHKKRKAISKAMSKEQKSFSKMFSHIKSLMQGK